MADMIDVETYEEARQGWGEALTMVDQLEAQLAETERRYQHAVEVANAEKRKRAELEARLP